MRAIYSIVIFLYQAVIRLAAIAGNQKAKLWVEGRKKWVEILEKKLAGKNSERVWIHCASLGEFEQGRPLIEKIKSESPSTCIVLSFFSPSGYEIRKNYPLADVICYLPIDSKRNSKRFLEIVEPKMVFFVKYEFWINYLNRLGQSGTPLYLVSAIFRPGQIFFKWYGNLFRKALKNVSHFFVQDENSKTLLQSIGQKNVTVTGDTRFDRVFEITSARKPIPLIEKFKANRKLIVAGSTWKEDEEKLLDALLQIDTTSFAFVIASHEVDEKRTNEIINAIHQRWPGEKIVTYSSGMTDGTERFFILDTIGILSSVYFYGTIAWIGGGFGKGIHNTLEAAAFGNPVLFGPRFSKFKEAVELVRLGGAFPVDGNAKEILEVLIQNPDRLAVAGKIAADYVSSNCGASLKIIEHTSLSKQKV